MKKLFVLIIALVLAGWAASVSANESSNEGRRAQVKGRQLVWITPAEPQPYALTGQVSNPAETRRTYSSRVQGRSGHSPFPSR
jgi:hypothetical protein